MKPEDFQLICRALGFGSAIRDTQGSPELGALDALVPWAQGRQRLTLVVPDATRGLPAGLVTATLARLDGYDVTAVVAIGLHRPASETEWGQVPHLAELRASGVRVVEDGGQGPTVAMPSGHAFARAVVETDGIVVLGRVELHQYAGFSGGVKSVAVGCAAPETIGTIHRPILLNHPGVIVGNVDGNPFRDQLADLVADLPPMFEVQVVESDDCSVVTAGPAPTGWLAAVAAARPFVDVPLAQAAIVRVAGGKGRNLYQASRGITQLVLQAGCPVVAGGPIVLLAAGQDGLGDGPGERACAQYLERGTDWLLERMRSFGGDDRCGGGAQRAFMIAKTGERHPVGYVALRECRGLAAAGWRYLGSEADVRRFVGVDEYLRVPDPLAGKMPRAG